MIAATAYTSAGASLGPGAKPLQASCCIVKAKLQCTAAMHRLSDINGQLNKANVSCMA